MPAKVQGGAVGLKRNEWPETDTDEKSQAQG